MTIAPYTPDHESEVRAFNHRLAAGGVRFQFPGANQSTAGDDSDPVMRRGFVAVEEGQSVRGGYLIKEQEFWLRGRPVRLGYLHLPLSEGLIDRRFSAVGVRLITHALRRQPLLFGLGIGGRDEAFAQVVSALGWTLDPVPFFFKLLKPARVARGLVAVRGTRVRQAALDLAAFSGAATIGAHALQFRRRPSSHPVVLEAVGTFASVGDPVWAACRDHFMMVARRDALALDQIHDDRERPYLRWVLRSGDSVVAWAVVLDTQMRGHKYFGDLRVATLVDLFGDPRFAVSLVDAVTARLRERGVDLVVTNQSSSTWAGACRQSGFLERTSNFFFAASPALARELTPLTTNLGALHLTRGDGDGPLNL